MAVAVCRAKDPNSCRVHGSGGAVEMLQKVADNAAMNHDMQTYLTTRAQIEAMTDEDAVSFIAPDTGNLIVDNWKNSAGELIPEAPNDMLLSNLSQSSAHPLPDTEAVTNMLRSRGYEDKDLFLAKHFRFKKDDSSDYGRDVTAMEFNRASMEIEKKHGKAVTFDQRDAFISERFNIIRYDVDVTKSQCNKFVDDYTAYVIAQK